MRFVTDTHSLFWYLSGSQQLSPSSKQYFDDSGNPGDVVIPIIAIAELLWLLRKKSIHHSFEKILGQLEVDPRFEIHSLSTSIVRRTVSLPIFEIHDALIVATALHLDLPLMTSDHKIIESGVVQTLRP